MWRQSIWAPLCPLVTRWGQWSRPSRSPGQKEEQEFSVEDIQYETIADKIKRLEQLTYSLISGQCNRDTFESKTKEVLSSNSQCIVCNNNISRHLHSLDHHQLLHQWLCLPSQIHGPFQHDEGVDWWERGMHLRVTLYRQHQGNTEERVKSWHKENSLRWSFN